MKRNIAMFLLTTLVLTGCFTTNKKGEVNGVMPANSVSNAAREGSGTNAAVGLAVYGPAMIYAAIKTPSGQNKDTISGQCVEAEGMDLCRRLRVQVRQGARAILNMPLADRSFFVTGLEPGYYRVLLLFKGEKEPRGEVLVSPGQFVELQVKPKPPEAATPAGTEGTP